MKLISIHLSFHFQPRPPGEPWLRTTTAHAPNNRTVTKAIYFGNSLAIAVKVLTNKKSL